MESIKQEKDEIFCSISVESSDEWIHGIISYINFKKNIIEVFLSAKHLKDNFKHGSKVIIKSLNNENEFHFTGSVEKKIVSINKQAVILKIDETKKYSNARNYERFRVNFGAAVKTEEGEIIPAVLSDISRGGVSLSTKSSFDEGNNIMVEILVNPRLSMSFNGKIVRKLTKGNIHNYGVKFEETVDENMDQLNELIEFLIIQKNHIIHEWKLFKRVKYTVYAVSLFLVFFMLFFVLAAEGR